MRWNNQGHEYDVMYKNMERINQIYMFGAGLRLDMTALW